MNGTKDKKLVWYISAGMGLLAALWLAVLIAPIVSGGLPQMLPKLGDVFSHPFRLSWCKYTLPCVGMFIVIYALTLVVYHYTKPNYRRRVEHGSAAWGDAEKICRKYRQEPSESNKILTQNLAIGYNTHAHRRNMNTLVVGGSGAGKTRFYAKPNIMQANTSFVILDPNGKEVLGYILQAVH